ncbi:MAG: sulfotransferase [Spirochaetaceae bacterium]|nr:sulfotransferase [Myxococcales bacterium]MCB9724688.1 sulfotransferase [Spirochaetaceae bacterium]
MAGQKIRIDDLAKPVLSDAQKAAVAYGERVETDLSTKAVLEAAVERTGLEDFGADDFHERLDLWLACADEPNRTGLGRMIHFNDCVRYAATRLRIRDYLKQHPEIHDVKIERPIIVIGLPRSGTTHLVNLIAADQRLRSMPLWEGQEPVPVPGEVPDADGHDGRWHRCNEVWQNMRSNSPLLAAMHPMEPDHIHEELEFLLPDFTSYNIEWVVRAPKWRDYYLAHDQTPHYQGALLEGLQILQYHMPRERWVLKCPQHLEQIGPLMKTFPDATIVVTHRDPVSVIQSAATMLAYGARTSYRSTDPEWYLEYWHDRVRRLLEASVRDRHLLPSDRTIDVLFHEFMADDVAMVEKIYDVAGLPMTNDARRQIDEYMVAHPRGKDGQVVYDLRADFGADPAELRRAFDFYFDRFDVRVEVK